MGKRARQSLSGGFRFHLRPILFTVSETIREQLGITESEAKSHRFAGILSEVGVFVPCDLSIHGIAKKRFTVLKRKAWQR